MIVLVVGAGCLSVISLSSFLACSIASGAWSPKKSVPVEVRQKCVALLFATGMCVVLTLVMSFIYAGQKVSEIQW